MIQKLNLHNRWRLEITMEQEDNFDPIFESAEVTSQDVTTGESLIVDQVVMRVPYSGPQHTEAEVEE